MPSAYFTAGKIREAAMVSARLGYDTSAWFWGSMLEILITKYLL